MLRFALLFILLFTCAVVVTGDSSGKQKTQATTTVKVYFGDLKRNPNSDPCSLVFPVNRVVPKTSAVAKAALEQLFMGPTEKEKADGYYSWFTPESKSILKSINIKNKTAYVNLHANTFAILSGSVSTSCGSQQFLAEMENTILQFPTIKKVFFAVNGNPQDFYEFLQYECPEELKNCDASNFK